MAVCDKTFRLDERVAIVTGGGGAIGGAICLAFSHAGAKVACLDFDKKSAEAVVIRIEEAGGIAIAVECDVGSESSTRHAAAEVQAKLGAPRVLVNCAAVLDKTGTVLDIDLDEWNRVMRVNLTGAFLTSRAVLPAMISAGGGSIIHIASSFASVGNAGRVSYCTAKSGLLQLAKTMAIDHAAQNVRVNTLSPGAIDTPRIAFRHGSNADEARRRVAAKHLLGRHGQPEEIASAALFLASDASSFMTGADLLVDGGYCAV